MAMKYIVHVDVDPEFPLPPILPHSFTETMPGRSMAMNRAKLHRRDFGQQADIMVEFDGAFEEVD